MKFNKFSIFLILLYIIAIASIQAIKPAIGILLAIGSIIIPTIFIKPEIGFFIYIGLLPLEGFFGNTTLNSVVTPARFFLIATMLIVVSRWLVRKERLPFDKIDIIFPVLFFIVNTISLINSKDHSLTFNRLSVLTGLIIGYFLVPMVIRDKKLAKTTVTILLFSGTILAIIGLYQYFNGEITDGDRITSLMNDPNYLGNFLAVVFSIGICNLFSASRWSKKVFLLILNIILISSMLFTFSRGSIVAVFGSLVFLAVKFPYKKIGITLLLVFIAFIVIIYIHFLTSLDPHQRMIKISDNAAYARFYFSKAALVVMLNEPIFGVGLGNFIVNCNDYVSFKAFYGEGYAHNMFLEVGAETGIFGLLLFLGIVMKSFKNISFSMGSTDKELFYINLAFTSALIVLIIQGLTVSFQYSKILWFLFGTSIALRELSVENPKDLSVQIKT